MAAVPENRELAKKLVLEIFYLQKQLKNKSLENQAIKHKIKAIHSQIELEEAEAVARAKDISLKEYEYLLAKKSLTDEKRYQLHKYILKQRYGVEVTPELKLRDDRGYYFQLLMHYYLIGDRNYFRSKDFQEWNHYLKIGEGKVFLPDLKTYTLKIEALKALNIPAFIDINREFKETDSDLLQLKNTAKNCSNHIKRALELGRNYQKGKEEISSIKILSIILNLLGLKLKRQARRVYKIDELTFYDGRQEIFQIWQQRDLYKTDKGMVV